MNSSSPFQRALTGFLLLLTAAAFASPPALQAQEKTAKERQEEALQRIQERLQELREHELRMQEETLQRVHEHLQALQDRDLTEVQHRFQALQELKEAQAQHQAQAMLEARAAYERALEMHAQADARHLERAEELQVKLQEAQLHYQLQAERAREEAEKAASEAREAYQEAQEIFIRMGSKIRLGVELDGNQGEEYDRQGALLRGVIDGSPAEEAGLREGDVITHLNGHSLLEPLPDPEKEEELDEEESVPVQRLMALASELDPGDEVEVRYLRDGRAEEVTFEAADVEQPGVWVLGDELEGRGVFRIDPDRRGVWHFRMPEGRAFSFRTPRFDSAWVGRFEFDSLGVGEFEFDSLFVGKLDLDTLNLGVFKVDSLGGYQMFRDLDLDWERGPGRLALRYGAGRPFLSNIYTRFGFEGIELQELNPDLAEYFSTDAGVLVLEVDEDSELGLRAGDVIQAIDGREVEDIGDVRRILNSYEQGEIVTFQVMRRGQAATVEGVVS